MKTYNEFLATYEDPDELFLEMANVSSRWTGIEDVIIWIGANPKSHGIRVKISNIKNRWSTDNFTISIPDYRIRNGAPAPWVQPKINDIIDWLKLNRPAIQKYEENDTLQDSGDFLELLKKI